MTFELNRCYRRDDIHDLLGGGNRQTYLTTQAERQPLTVFLKEGDRWRYVGMFKSVPRKPTAAELTEQQLRSRRDDVTTVVWMEAADSPT